MPTDQKVIYLTFDDGPTPEITQWTLDLLKSYNAKATFFCIGNNIENHPEIFNTLLKDGHAVGNHTYHHLQGWITNSDVYVKEVLKTQELIRFQIANHKILKIDYDKHSAPIEKGGYDGSSMAKLFRPPYGKITPKQGNRLLDLDYKIIMWDILAFDWLDSLSEEQCAKNVISKAVSGSIVVFHDSVKASKRMKYALTRTLEHFSKKGYEFKSL